MAPGACKSSLCHFFILLESNQLISDHLVRHALLFAPNYSFSHLVQLKKVKNISSWAAFPLHEYE